MSLKISYLMIFYNFKEKITMQFEFEFRCHVPDKNILKNVKYKRFFNPQVTGTSTRRQILENCFIFSSRLLVLF